MLQFIRTKRKTKLNKIYYYAVIRYKYFNSVCIYGFNSRIYVDLRLCDNLPNSIRVDRYTVTIADTCVLHQKSYCKKLVKHLILYAYEKKELS